MRLFVMILWVILLFQTPKSCCGGSNSNRLRGRGSLNNNHHFATTAYYNPKQKFKSLHCNQNLYNAPCKEWSSIFGNTTTFRDPFKVPCGQCIVMDVFHYEQEQQEPPSSLISIPTTVITFLQGLDIQGKLIIPDMHHHQLHIRTTYIIVQGEFHLRSTKPITNNPSIKVTFIKNQHNDDILFSPIDTNKYSCSKNFISLDDMIIGKCNIGNKAFVVAGGKVMIRGLPSSTMPTWMPIYNLQSSSISRETTRMSVIEYNDYITNYYYKPPPPIHLPRALKSSLKNKNKNSNENNPYEFTTTTNILPPMECPEDGIYINVNFSNNNERKNNNRYNNNIVSAQSGSDSEYTNDSLRITNRTNTKHGPIIDFADIRHCLEVNQTYLFTARIRLSQQQQQYDSNNGNSKNNNKSNIRSTRQNRNFSECYKTKGKKGCMNIVSEYHYLLIDNDDTNYDTKSKGKNLRKKEYENDTIISSSVIKWKEQESYEIKYGIPFTVAIELHFNEHELKNSLRNIYHVMALQQVPIGIDIELIDLQLRLAPPPELFDDNTTIASSSSTSSPSPVSSSFVSLIEEKEEETMDIDGNRISQSKSSSTTTTTSTTICRNLVPGNNGDAEKYGRSPFPFRTNNPFANIFVVYANEEDDKFINNNKNNHYFRIQGRKYSSNGSIQSLSNGDDDDCNAADLAWTIPKPCLQEGSLYSIHADVRIHVEHDNDDPVEMKISIRGHRQAASTTSYTTAPPFTLDEKELDIYVTLIKCPPSKNQWVSCDGTFTVPSHLIIPDNGNVDSIKETPIARYEILFETINTYSVDYDLDNLSFELIEGPLDELIVQSTNDFEYNNNDKNNHHHHSRHHDENRMIQNRWWSIGAELLITSHTNHWDDHQVVSIKKVSRFNNEEENVPSTRTTKSGLIKIRLDRPIRRRPTTIIDSPHYATEVALLSRNIVFEGEFDNNKNNDQSQQKIQTNNYFNNNINNNQHHQQEQALNPPRDDGAYFVVLDTINVSQYIAGAEFRNFGQKQKLDTSSSDNDDQYYHKVMNRYPIHFENCDNSTGTVIFKNTIRQSNQRCIVLQDTNYVKINGNVAFDTYGHCYVIGESGQEIGNDIRNNLGAFTRKGSSTTTTSSSSSVDKKSNKQQEEIMIDDTTTPATYYITNPSNTWENNVAAGSQMYGFWMDLSQQHSIRDGKAQDDSHHQQHDNTITTKLFDPTTMNLTLFKDNVAHSNMNYSLKVTGYKPIEEAIFLGFRSYLNHDGPMHMNTYDEDHGSSGGGLDFSKSTNLAMVNGIFDEEFWPIRLNNNNNIDNDHRDNVDELMIVRNTTVVANHPTDGCKDEDISLLLTSTWGETKTTSKMINDDEKTSSFTSPSTLLKTPNTNNVGMNVDNAPPVREPAVSSSSSAESVFYLQDT